MGSTASHRASSIASIREFTEHQLPLTYLSVRIYAGRIKGIYFEHLIDKVRYVLQGNGPYYLLLESFYTP